MADETLNLHPDPVSLRELRNNNNDNYTKVNNNFTDHKNRIDNLIAQSGTSDTEVVDARYDSVNNVTHVVLKDRLDNTASQLAQIAINIKTFGAIGDGGKHPLSVFFTSVDEAKKTYPFVNSLSEEIDQAALIKAVYYVSDQGGGKVYIPKGTYLLNTMRYDNNVLIELKSNVTVFGEGKESVLKVVDNIAGIDYVNAPYGFNVFCTPNSTNSYVIENVRFADFVIDFNGANNLVPSDLTYGKRNAGIAVRYGRNIKVENVIFKENSGQNCIVLGGNINPHTVKDVVIERCEFINTGNSVVGNTYQTDHSCIYVQVNGISVVDNLFANDSDRTRNSGAAIECHSSDAIVKGNIIKGFLNGVHIVAIVTNKESSIYQSNILKNVGIGFRFWQEIGMVMRDVKVDNNIIQQQNSLRAAIDIDTSVNAPIRSAEITNNSVYFEGIPENFPDAYASGIRIGKIYELTIKGNKIKDMLGRGIELGAEISNGVMILTIENNEILNCGRTVNTTSDTYKSGIVLYSASTISKLNIKNNTILNHLETSLKYGIIANCGITDGRISNNTIVDIVNEIRITPLNASTIGTLILEHQGKESPREKTVASVGSKWLENGIEWTQWGNEVASWRRITRSNAPPLSGDYKVGDEVINTVPTAGTYGKWVCITAGIPGIWKGVGLIEA